MVVNIMAPFGSLNTWCRIILRTQKGTIILTTTHAGIPLSSSLGACKGIEGHAPAAPQPPKWSGLLWCGLWWGWLGIPSLLPCGVYSVQSPPSFFSCGVGSCGWESPPWCGVWWVGIPLPPRCGVGFGACGREASLVCQTIFCWRKFCSETLRCPFRCFGRLWKFLLGTIQYRTIRPSL